MSIYIKRRKELAKELENNSLTIIFGSREKYRNNDIKYKFRQNSNFLYLIGLNKPNTISLLEKKNDNIIISIFSPKSNAKDLIWDDDIMEKKEIIDNYRVDYVFSIDEFEKKVFFFIKNKNTIYYISEDRKYYKNYILYILYKYKFKDRFVKDINYIVHNHRILKDKKEVELVKKACLISSKAHINIINKIRPSIKEYELEAAFLKECMSLGGVQQAYNPIFASGDNACILHYSKNNKLLNDNELILIDAGCEYKNYASDITRTYPINGTFNQEQKLLYEIVLHAQKEAIKICKIGKNWNDINKTIIDIISYGLKYLNILNESVENIIDKKLYKHFYMHGPGHWIGLDVHDTGDYKKNDNWVSFQKNMYLTIEPGIYISKKNLDINVDDKWKGIGIRIEDDILIKEVNNEILSKSIPKEIKDIEDAIK
jgi:Xaa-Pro aminopeptidase